MLASWRKGIHSALGALLCLFAVVEVNYPTLAPQSQLAIFAMLGLLLCYLTRSVHPRVADRGWSRRLDLTLAALTVLTFGYVVVQSEPLFRGFWISGQTLGNRAGNESSVDIVVGAVGLLLILEATRRTIGQALPILAGLFLTYAFVGPYLPGWLFPHRGYGVDRVVGQAFLHTQGVFGTALRVMFVYVFLFVVFGAFLKETGATQFVIDFARRLFGSSPGGPAKVAVLSSGLMGSLSGSAVANTATTGTFTIPMMRSAGFRREIAGGIEAAASSGGALVPPVMGAGAYMMLELVDPPVTYVEIIRSALIPAVLYYLSLLLIVHFYGRRIGAGTIQERSSPEIALWRYEGLIFASAILGLLALLLAGYTVFRAVTLAIVLVWLLSAVHPRTRVTARKARAALEQSARDVVPLISAAACVGIIIGIVTLTGIGTKLPVTILHLAQGNLLGALVLIMISSIILGMGLPSAVCYLLMATLVGPVLGDLGVVPLAAHLFIFYFGMMSMVTPPVALAAYTASSIAGAAIMPTSLAAFRFALVGFTLPYMFVFRPELLMLAPGGGPASPAAILGATLMAAAGIVPFAAGISGYLIGPLSAPWRVAALVAAALVLQPQSSRWLPLSGLLLLGLVIAVNLVQRRAGRGG